MGQPKLIFIAFLALFPKVVVCIENCNASEINVTDFILANSQELSRQDNFWDRPVHNFNTPSIVYLYLRIRSIVEVVSVLIPQLIMEIIPNFKIEKTQEVLLTIALAVVSYFFSLNFIQ